MTIARVEVFEVSHRMARLRIYAIGSHWTRDSVLVKVSDSDGRTGWGETYLVAGVVATIDALAGRLVGRVPEDAGVLCTELLSVSRNGWAVGAISMALDDLRGKRLGVPVSALHGGAVRERVRAYASSGGYVEDMELGDAWIREAETMRALGFTALKYRVGRFSPDVELPALRRARDEVPGIEMMADGNAGWTVPQSIRVALALDELGFSWLEEPLPQADYAGYERVAAASDIPLAGGELVETRGEARHLLNRSSIDIIQPDAAICGGVGEVLFIAALARLDGVPCIPHTCNGAVMLAATLQALACLPDGANLPGGGAPLLECDAGENPIRTELLAAPIRMDPDGWFTIPTGPGLGIEVDEDFARAHRA